VIGETEFDPLYTAKSADVSGAKSGVVSAAIHGTMGAATSAATSAAISAAKSAAKSTAKSAAKNAAIPAWYRDELAQQTVPEQAWQRKRLQKWQRKQARRGNRMTENTPPNQVILQNQKELKDEVAWRERHTSHWLSSAQSAQSAMLPPMYHAKTHSAWGTPFARPWDEQDDADVLARQQAFQQQINRIHIINHLSSTAQDVALKALH